MYLLIAAVATSVLGVLPLFLRKRPFAGTMLGLCSFLVTWGLYYIVKPSTIWPLLGIFGAMTALVWLIAAIIDAMEDEDFSWLFVLPIGYVVLFFITALMSSGIFNAATFATMVGTIEEREWTKDIQPKDPRHMRMVSDETALYIAQKAVGTLGTIGSQFELDDEHMTLQRVNDRLVYVIPFDFSGFSRWLNASGVPGYVVVDAEDTERQPELVRLDKDRELHFTPGAFFGNNLERHLRNSGYLNQGFFSFRFELDDNNRSWWVISTYRPTVTWSGAKITGVLIVDPVSGAIKEHAFGSVPDWVDRVVPGELVEAYISWRGSFSSGWLNSWWGTKDLTKPETPILIYGSNNRAEWVTGITSHSDKDDSLVGLMYTDSRTGKSVYYRVTGGGTDAAIIQAVNNNSQIKFRHLRATTPQIYNVLGTMAAVVPLVNENGSFQGTAIVEVKNVQDVAVGITQNEALRNYEVLITRRGQQVAFDSASVLQKLSGVVDRIRLDVGQNGSVYYFHIAGTPRIFTASSQDYPKLPLTQPGDSVALEYVASEQETVPVRKFDNLSLVVAKGKMQEEVERAAEKKQDAEAARDSKDELSRRLKNMSPEELKRLEGLMNKK